MTILESGINLMLYGMGTVFVFLSILIITTITMSWVISKFFGTPEVEPAAEPSRSIHPASDQIAPPLLGILQAAVNAHKK